MVCSYQDRCSQVLEQEKWNKKKMGFSMLKLARESRLMMLPLRFFCPFIWFRLMGFFLDSDLFELNCKFLLLFGISWFLNVIDLVLVTEAYLKNIVRKE